MQELAYNLWWCWNHDAISLLRRIDEKTFEQPSTARSASWRASGRNGSNSSRTTKASWPRCSRVLESSEPLSEQLHLVSRDLPQEDRRSRRRPQALPHRLFLGRVRHARERADLFRRPGRCWPAIISSRRRDLGIAAGRRRPDVPRGLFPPVSQRRRLAAGTLSRERLLQSAADRRDASPTARRS